jgi:starvation-inducible DNA-binding protein
MDKLSASHLALPDDTRRALVESLNTVLATSIDLQQQVKQAHWNVKGPQFFARHELFDRLATRLRAAADEIAERAATLGGYATGTVRLVAERSKIPEYDLDAVDGRAHMRALAERFGSLSALLRVVVEEADSKGDPVTSDLLTQTLRTVELDLWFLESHLNV